MSENDLKYSKTEIPDKWKNLNEKLADPYESFKSINDDQKPTINLKKKEDFFSKLENTCASDKKRTRNKVLIYSLLKKGKNKLKYF